MELKLMDWWGQEAAGQTDRQKAARDGKARRGPRVQVDVQYSQLPALVCRLLTNNCCQITRKKKINKNTLP